MLRRKIPVNTRRKINRTRGDIRMSETTTATPAEIRAWAVAKGFEVGTRGRISASVREAYEAEQAKKAARAAARRR